MTITSIEASQHQAAKVAGFTLLFGMAIVIFGQFYLSPKLIVPGSAVDTARQILAQETLFRLNIICDLIYVVNVVVLLSALYVILKPVNPGLALAAAVCRLLYAVMWMITTLNILGAPRLLGSASYLGVLKQSNCRAWPDSTSLQISTRITLACRSLDWRPRFAVTYGSSRDISPIESAMTYMNFSTWAYALHDDAIMLNFITIWHV